MNFIIDAQLPRRLARYLNEAGHDAIHTLDLPIGNRTSDSRILAIAAHQARIVVTKDADFVSSFLVFQRPERLLLISTGNITNVELESLLLSNLTAIVAAFAFHRFVELTRTSLIIHT